MHWEIFDPVRQKLLPKLAFTKSSGIYLAGGTALALHLGHRRSVDFDFYSTENFEPVSFEARVVQHIENFVVTQRSAGTLLGKSGAVEVTFFYYPYPMLEEPVESDHVRLASIADIAAMKIIALTQRGLRRDFLDLYVIARAVGLQQILEWTRKKYAQFDPYITLKSLTYFTDAENDTSGRGMELTEPVPWPRIKGNFEKETIRFSKLWL